MIDRVPLMRKAMNERDWPALLMLAETSDLRDDPSVVEVRALLERLIAKSRSDVADFEQESKGLIGQAGVKPYS